MSITLLTLNIYKNGSGYFPPEKRTAQNIEERLRDIANNIIRHEEPHIVALQEVDHSAKRSCHLNGDEIIANALGREWSTKFVKAIPMLSNHGSKAGKYGNAILTRLNVEEYAKKQLPKEDDKEEKAAIRMHFTLGSERLVVINVHLGLTKAAQRSQLLGIREMVQGISHETHIILCGDFNISDSNDLGENFLRYEEMLQLLNEPSSINPFVDMGPSGEATFAKKKKKRKIDYIFLRIINNKLVASAEVIKSQNLSDHHGVKLTLTLKEESVSFL